MIRSIDTDIDKDHDGDDYPDLYCVVTIGFIFSENVPHQCLTRGEGLICECLRQTLRKRQRRSLLPIVGKALSFLFGTVSEDDLNSIKQGVNNLANNQKKISHIVEKTLTILDTTRLEVSENRQEIDGLIVALSNVSIQIQSDGHKTTATCDIIFDP